MIKKAVERFVSPGSSEDSKSDDDEAEDSGPADPTPSSELDQALNSSEEEFVQEANELTVDADYLEEDSVNALVTLPMPTSGMSTPWWMIQILMFLTQTKALRVKVWLVWL